MQTKLVMNLSLFGVIVGCLNIFGLTKDIEWIFWLTFWFMASALILKKEKNNLFVASFLAGMIFAILVHLVQVIGFDMFVQNNTDVQERLKTLSVGTNPRIYYLSLGLLISVGNGGILSLITLGLRYFQKSSK